MPATPPTSTWRRARPTDVVANYTVTDEHGAHRHRDADHHADRHQRRAGRGGRHQRGQRGHTITGIGRRPTTATSTTARRLTYSAQCAGRRRSPSTPTAATASMPQRRLPAPGAGRDRRTWSRTYHRHRRARRAPTTATLTITVTGTNDAPVAGGRHQRGQRGHASSPARSRPTTATSTTAHVPELRAQRAGRPA